MKFDLKTFLDEYSSNQPLSIDGIAIGTPMAHLPISYIESSDPDVDYPRSYRHDKMYRVYDDGSEKELSPEFRYKEVEQYGGWLRKKGVSWYIKDKTVQRYAIRGEHLSSFNIETEQKIVELFGKPKNKSMSSCGIEYYYLESQLAIVWSRKKGNLESIRVGDFVQKKESLEHDLRKGVLYVSGVRKIQLSSLEQRYTYEGLLEGRPTSEMNNGIIKRAMTDARSRSYSNVHLIEPHRIEPELKEPYPFGVPENLPAIRCIAEFKSLDPAKDENADGSILTFVWFQSALAMPIEESVCNEIESVNWDGFATDEYY